MREGAGLGTILSAEVGIDLGSLIKLALAETGTTINVKEKYSIQNRY